MDIIKVLIADDSVQIVDMMEKHISLIEGVEIVATACDGQDEIDKIKEFKPDLVFTDNQMPKLNGIDVIDLIKNSEDIKSPEFVIITGDRDIELIKKANSLNVMRLLNKPIDYSAIQDIITEFELINNKNQIPKKIMRILRQRRAF